MFQIVAVFYIILVALLVGTNLGPAKKRMKTSMDKTYVVQFKEGEGVKCEVVEGREKTEEEFRLVENVWSVKIVKGNVIYNSEMKKCFILLIRQLDKLEL